jgi:large subunit ribosomal protein L24
MIFMNFLSRSSRPTGPTRGGFRRDEVTKRRPDGSTYTAHRSVRVARKSGEEI